MRRITTDVQICHGKAHVEGTRIPVHIILDFLASGETCENILQAYPSLLKRIFNFASNMPPGWLLKKWYTSPR